MKTILFVSPNGVLDNGSEISIVNLMKYLSSHGYKIINVIPLYGHPGQLNYTQTCLENGIIVVPLLTYFWWWKDSVFKTDKNDSTLSFYYRKNIREIRQLIQENKVDLVVTNSVNMFQGAVAAACEGVTHFWLIHEFPENEFAYYLEKLDFIEDYSDEIFAVTGELKKRLSQLITKKQIKSFIPYTEIKPHALSEAEVHRIVCIGRVSDRKNQIELIKAYQVLQNHNIKLVFIGGWDNEYKKICDEYIKKNNLENISFVGNQEYLWKNITNQDICVLPSKEETFGLAYIEALLNGVPVIASNNKGYLSAFELFGGGSLYPLGEVVSLSNMMKDLLSNFKIAKQEAIEVSTRIQKEYSLENSYKELIHDIEEHQLAKKKSLRHIADLITLDKPETSVERIKDQISKKLRYIKQRISKI